VLSHLFFEVDDFLQTGDEPRIDAARRINLFVIHAEKTLQSNVERALAAIESCPVKLLILNAAKLPAQGTYGYGYGYGYGQGYGARE